MIPKYTQSSTSTTHVNNPTVKSSQVYLTKDMLRPAASNRQTEVRPPIRQCETHIDNYARRTATRGPDHREFDIDTPALASRGSERSSPIVCAILTLFASHINNLAMNLRIRSRGSMNNCDQMDDPTS